MLLVSMNLLFRRYEFARKRNRTALYLLSLSIMSLSFIHFVAYVRALFLLKVHLLYILYFTYSFIHK